MMINEPKRGALSWAAVFGVVGTLFLLAGCQIGGPMFADWEAPAGSTSDNFSVGDWVAVAFSGTDSPPPGYQEVVKGDGTINPPMVGTVVAAGKTPGELQKELQDKYDRIYNHLTVTVTSQGRYYYVSGEVRAPGPKAYLGETDIIKAISAAGDFTDFANKKKVRLTHNGHTRVINVLDAIEDTQFHVSVYPGDKIVVPRRFF